MPCNAVRVPGILLKGLGIDAWMTGSANLPATRILDLMCPNGQSCLEKKARDVNDRLFSQMWISHPKGI
jgi:hypothetical protein